VNEERTGECLRQVEHVRGHLWHRYSITFNQVIVMTSTLPKGTLGSVASLLAAILYQGNPDRNLWFLKDSNYKNFLLKLVIFTIALAWNGYQFARCKGEYTHEKKKNVPKTYNFRIKSRMCKLTYWWLLALLWCL